MGNSTVPHAAQKVVLMKSLRDIAIQIVPWVKGRFTLQAISKTI